MPDTPAAGVVAARVADDGRLITHPAGIATRSEELDHLEAVTAASGGLWELWTVQRTTAALERLCAACHRPRFSDRHLAEVTRERDAARARVSELVNAESERARLSLYARNARRAIDTLWKSRRGHQSRASMHAGMYRRARNSEEAALEAAQREPIGYVVVAKRPNRHRLGGFEYGAAGSIWLDREPVENHQAHCEATAEADPERFGVVGYLIVELHQAVTE